MVSGTVLSRRTRGTAMMEMVLVLPLLLLFLTLLLFLGRGLVRVQHAQVMDRYEAWRQASGSPGPSTNEARGNPQMNQTFFADNAATIEYAGGDEFPSDARDALLAGTQRARQPATFPVAQRLLASAEGGRSVSFRTTHTRTGGLWGRIDGPIHHSHTRIGHDWAITNRWKIDRDRATRQDHRRYVEYYVEYYERYPGATYWARDVADGPNIMAALSDTVLKDFNDELNRPALRDNPLARALRELYLDREDHRDSRGYRGPDPHLWP